MSIIKPKLEDFSWIYQGRHLRTPNDSESSLLLPYQDHSYKQDKKALLLLHGFASSPGVFRYFFPDFKNYDMVYAPTLKGHGQSIEVFSQVSRKDWVQQVQDLLQDLCQRYQQVDVLGLSMGGVLAAYTIHDFPIHHLYLLAPAFELTKPLNLLLNTAAVVKSLGFKSIANFGGKISNPKEAELSFRQLPITSIIEVLRLIKEYPHRAWSTPTTVFLGKKDTVVSSPKVASMLENLPHLNLNILEQTNHVLPIDKDYQSILKQLNQLK
jgi:carboxylesterase